MEIKDYTTEQLNDEIGRRQHQIPKVLDNPNYEILADYLERLLVRVQGGVLPKHFEEVTFQLAMDVVFGHGSWRYWWKINTGK